MAGTGDGSRRDATALTLVAVDLRTLGDPLLRAPTYRPVLRRQWVGVQHTRLYGEIRALAETWQVRRVVVDATGVGAGLASFLERALPGRVIPFHFNQASKSQLGWDFLALVDSGRWQEVEPAGQYTVQLPAEPAAGRAGKPGADGPLLSDLVSIGPHFSEPLLSDLFFHQLRFCQYEVLPGQGKLLRWGVPDGTRDPRSGAYVHDDLVISAALSAVLDRQPWPKAAPREPGLIPARDPLEDMRGF